MEGNLNNFRAGNLPTVICKPDFITETEETYLLDKIYAAPLSRWKSLKNRRLQNWGGIVHEKGLLPQDLPPWLTNITERILEQSGLFPATINHVLINEYLPNQGIMPHQDGPAYFPVVAILSLGSPAVMNFTPHSRLSDCVETKRAELDIETDEGIFKHRPFSVLLNPRSLLIFKDDAYSDYLHGIEDCEVHKYYEGVGDGEKVIHRTRSRVSLTCRLVPKVQKKLFKF